MGDNEGEDGEPQNEALTLDMGAAMIESEMEKLCSLLPMMDDPYFKKWMAKFENELKVLVSFMREKKLEEGSRLNYLISEVLEMLGIAQRCFRNGDATEFEILDLLQQTNRQLREEGWRSEEDGDGEGDVVGFDEDVKLLLHKIYMSQKKLWVAEIRGMVGCGKTTLAKLVYNHADVVHKFEFRVWVNCSKIISLKELVINIIWQVAGGDEYPKAKAVVEMQLADLFEILDKQLQGKQFIIVLDHIGDGEIWVAYIARYLGNHANAKRGSILLLTSRSIMHEDAHKGDCLYVIKGLDVHKSWQLLLKKMLRSNDKFPKQAERKGMSVLMKHTGGLPLAIKEAAMEWADKRRQGIEWEAIVNSDDLELRATLKALDSSFYYKVKLDAKFAFLHLCLFKLGETIRPLKFKHTFAASGVLNSVYSSDTSHNKFFHNYGYIRCTKNLEDKHH